MQLRKKENEMNRREKKIREIRKFLKTMKMSKKLMEKVKQQFLQHTSKFALKGSKM